jgi:hypothetical protein
MMAAGQGKKQYSASEVYRWLAVKRKLTSVNKGILPETLHQAHSLNSHSAEDALYGMIHLGDRIDVSVILMLSGDEGNERHVSAQWMNCQHGSSGKQI